MNSALAKDEMIAGGTAKTEGDTSVIDKLKSALIHFELRFEGRPLSTLIKLTRKEYS
jgi:hypothetical protein